MRRLGYDRADEAQQLGDERPTGNQFDDGEADQHNEEAEAKELKDALPLGL